MSVSQAFPVIVDFFEPIYQHYLMTLPLCRAYRQQTSLSNDLWVALLQSPPFFMALPSAASEQESTMTSRGTLSEAQVCGDDMDTDEEEEEEPFAEGEDEEETRMAMAKEHAAGQSPSGVATFDMADDSDDLSGFDLFDDPLDGFSEQQAGGRTVAAAAGRAAACARGHETRAACAPTAPRACAKRKKAAACGGMTAGCLLGLGAGLDTEAQARRRAWRLGARVLHLRLSQAAFALDSHPLRPLRLPHVVAALERGRDCAALQNRAMDCLNALLEDEALRSAAQTGPVPALIFGVLRRFPSDEALLSRALYTTMLLLRPKGGSEGCLFKGDEMCSVRIGAVYDEGIEAVLATMQRHASSRRLQYMGCWALVNMALEQSHKLKLLRCGAIETVCAAMEVHGGDAKVQFRALFALINLVTIGGVSQTRSAAQAEALMRKVAAITDQYLHCVDVAGRGCMVLYNLSLDTANWAGMRRLRVASLLRRAADAHPTDAMLDFVASSTMARLSQNNGQPPGVPG